MPLSLRVVEMVWKHSVSFTICLPWIGRVKSILSQDDLNKKTAFQNISETSQGLHDCCDNAQAHSLTLF